MPPSRVAELAALVQSNTDIVDRYLREHDLPSPSFEENGPVNFGIESKDVQDARTMAIDASMELHELLLGPAMCLRPVVSFFLQEWSYSCLRTFPQLNGTSLQAIYKYDIPSKVPLHGEISFPELAGRCNLYEPDLRRILRFAIIYHRVFQERNAGFITHSAASRRLVDFPLAMDALGAQFDEAWQGFAHVGRRIPINMLTEEADLV